MNITFIHPLDHLVRGRFSCRTFSSEEPDTDAMRTLGTEALSLTRGLLGERSRFEMVDIPSAAGARFSEYGLISGARFFLVGGILPSERYLESYAFLMEQLVLRAIDLGLATCWVGYFAPEYFRNFAPKDGEKRPAVVVVGKAAEKARFRDRIVRATIRASSRKKWNELFFEASWETPLKESRAEEYAPSLEMVRLAPSSGNTQPWRILKEAGRPVFHFFMKNVRKAYAARGLHGVDIGIAMSHFHLSVREAGLRGEWVVSRPEGLTHPSDVEYRWTWRGAQGSSPHL